MECSLAAKKGDLTLLKALHKEGKQLDTMTTYYAAQSGNLEMLKYLYEHGCPWDENAPAVAAYYGHFECLQYLHENGCKWDILTAQCAAQFARIDMLKYLHENGCPWGPSITADAGKSGNLECLKFVYETCGKKWSSETVLNIVSRHNGEFIDCLQFAIENGCPYDLNNVLFYLTDQLKKEHLDASEWLCSFLFPLVNSPSGMTKQLNQLCKAKLAELQA